MGVGCIPHEPTGEQGTRMTIVPKKATPKSASDDRSGGGSNVRSIRSAGHGGGRKTSTTYDPATGLESTPKGYKAEATRESDAEFDVFSLVDDRKYSEARFYTRSVNADGHGERMQVRVPQGIDSQMHAAVAEVPEYKTIHDLIRDSVIHRLEFLQKRYNLGDGARRILELERIRSDLTRHSQETETMQEAVDDLEAALQRLWDKQDYGMMREMLDTGSEMYEWLRDPYKGKALGVLERWKATARVEMEKLQRRDEE